jgi:hypothetical protein
VDEGTGCQNVEQVSHQVDKLIGRNIRVHRLAKEMTQEVLGEGLALRFNRFKNTKRTPTGSAAVAFIRLRKVSKCLSNHYLTARRHKKIAQLISFRFAYRRDDNADGTRVWKDD